MCRGGAEGSTPEESEMQSQDQGQPGPEEAVGQAMACSRLMGTESQETRSHARRRSGTKEKREQHAKRGG